MDYTGTIEEVRKYAQAFVKASRYEHSVRVAEFCARLCRFYGLDEQKGYLAGIGHDICKDMSDEMLIETAKKDGEEITSYEYAKPGLLHGRAASIYLKEKFGVKDEDILEAVAVHVTGKIGLCDLSKALFIADKIEPGRPQVSEEYYNELFKLSLNDMFISVLKDNYAYVSKKGFKIFPRTKELVDYYSKG